MPKNAPPVLLVDDNREFAGLLGTLFAEQGFLPLLAHTAQDALQLLSRHQVVAAVIDLLLPDMTGQKLIQKIIKQGGELPPLFVISGVFKGQAQQDKLRAVAPVAGWYEKPFDTRTLVEAVAKATGHTVVARRAHAPIGKVTSNFEIDILEPDQSASGLKAESDDLNLSIDLALIEPEGPISKPWNVPTALVGESRAEPTPEPTPSPAQISAELRTNMREGLLEDTSVPLLLNAFFIAQETGEIVFERAEQRKMIIFEDGKPVFAMSNQDADRYGAVARRLDGLKPADVDRALFESKRSGKPMGEVLVEMGLIPPSRKAEILREQARAIIRSLFSWTTGRYVIGFKSHTNFDKVDLKEDLGTLIMDGVRDHFELDRLKAMLPDHLRLLPSPNASIELYDLPLHDQEARLVLRATGQHTVGELIEGMNGKLSEKAARATLYSLYAMGVLLPGIANPP